MKYVSTLYRYLNPANFLVIQKGVSLFSVMLNHLQQHTSFW